MEMLKSERRLGTVSIKLSLINYVEELKGWEVYDKVINEYARTIENNILKETNNVNKSIKLFIKYERSDEFLIFVPLHQNKVKHSSLYFDEYVENLNQYLKIKSETLKETIQLYELNLLVGKSIVDYKGIVRTERSIYNAVENARLDTFKQLEHNLEQHKTQIDKIIKNKNVNTVYQPIIDLKKNSVHGFEALSRFDVHNLSLNTEGVFILAMKLNLTRNLEKMCMETAVMSSKGIKKCHHLFINLDPNEITYGSINADAFTSFIKKYDLTPSNIVFEITERRYVSNLNDFNKKFDKFKKIGYKIAIDDFGAGYSNLNTIAVIKPDYLKIDINLIRDIDKDLVKKEIVKTLMQFAKKINVKVLSEGVETKEEADTLIELGSELGQGYLYGRPHVNLIEYYKKLEKNYNINQSTTKKNLTINKPKRHR
jgi:EAL domain-containing protein (putative c-di-GMP-specific phosphodiesterase class I)